MPVGRLRPTRPVGQRLVFRFGPRPQSIGPITSKNGKGNHLATIDKFLQPIADIHYRRSTSNSRAAIGSIRQTQLKPLQTQLGIILSNRLEKVFEC